MRHTEMLASHSVDRGHTIVVLGRPHLTSTLQLRPPRAYVRQYSVTVTVFRACVIAHEFSRRRCLFTCGP